MKYSDLKAWKKSVSLVELIYNVTRSLPLFERYELVAQMRRAAISIPSNLAEGCGRRANRAFINHISIAYGSLMELETQIHLCARLNYLRSDVTSHLLEKCNEIAKMLSGLRNSLLKVDF